IYRVNIVLKPNWYVLDMKRKIDVDF
mgnify:CR=1